MLTDMISVQPVPGSRVEFACWAVAQVPKVRTTSPATFAVPSTLFVDLPEHLLVGALVDGRRYVSPDEDSEQGTPPPEGRGGDLLGVATAAGFSAVATADPVTVRKAMDAVLAAADTAATDAAREAGDLPDGSGPAPVPDPVPVDEADTTGSDLPEPDTSDASAPGEEVPEGVFPCSGCEREFTTGRGLRMHSRQAHPED